MNCELLSFGMKCENSSNENYQDCYELVKEDFFDEITGDGYMSEAVRPNRKPRELTPQEKRKEWIKKRKKYIIGATAILAALGAIVLLAKKKDPDAAKEIQASYNRASENLKKAKAVAASATEVNDVVLQKIDELSDSGKSLPEKAKIANDITKSFGGEPIFENLEDFKKNAATKEVKL